MASSLLSPAIALPPGTTFDPRDPRTSAVWKWNVVCQTTCLFFTTVLFVLRTYIRAYVRRIFVLEDYMCCCAFMSLVLYSGVATATIWKGGGTHEWELTTSQAQKVLYYINLAQIFYGVAATTVKMAILVLYLGVFSPRGWNKLDLIIRAIMWIVGLFYLGLTTAKICQCYPRARIWDTTVPGTCVDLTVLLDISGGFNILSDVGILLVPLKGLWSLQMSRKRKAAVYAIFTVGAIAPIFSVIGFIKRFEFGSSPDKTHGQSIILLWVTAELAVGMMVICFPTLPGIVQRRTGKPSRSIINGSARSPAARAYLHRSRRSPDEGDLQAEGDYFELDEVRRAEAQLTIPPNAVVSRISVGVDTKGSEPFSGLEEYRPSKGILKTTRIEQTNV